MRAKDRPGERGATRLGLNQSPRRARRGEDGPDRWGPPVGGREKKERGGRRVGLEKKEVGQREGFWAAEKRMKTGWREKKRKGKENGPAGKKKKNEKESGLG